MPKTIIVESLARPEKSGYPDKIVVANDVLLYHDSCGACPNPRQPWVKGGKPWYDAYGWVQLGTYAWSCIQHSRRGKILLVNSGGRVPSRNPNPNHDGAHWLTEILVHKGWTATWRGSAGCITIPPSDWALFIRNFDIGETGEFKIVDYVRMRYEPQPCRRAQICPMFEEV